MLPDDVKWCETAGCLQLVHRGWPVATIHPCDGGSVEVTTGSYSQGFRPRRRMATEEGGRRYAEAWWSKWEPDIRRDIARKLHRTDEQSWPEGYAPPVYPDVQVTPRRPRRRR